MDLSFVWGHHHLHLAGMDDHSISCLIHYLLSTPSECHPFPKSTIVRIELSLLYHLFFKNICWCLNRWRHKWYKEHDHSIQSLRVKGLKVFKDPGKRTPLNEDTLLPMMFLGLRKLETFIADRPKMFLNKIRNNFWVPDTKFVSATNVTRAGKRGNICVGKNVSATMCLPRP